MSSQDARRARVKTLVFQDQGINETELKETHVHLEKSLVAWERRGRRILRIFWIACGVLVADLLAVLVIEGIPTLRGSDAVRGVWGAFALVSFIVAASCLVWYNDKYASAIRRVRFDLQMSMIRELHQQVETLRQEMNRHPG